MIFHRSHSIKDTRTFVVQDSENRRRQRVVLRQTLVVDNVFDTVVVRRRVQVVHLELRRSDVGRRKKHTCRKKVQQQQRNCVHVKQRYETPPTRENCPPSTPDISPKWVNWLIDMIVRQCDNYDLKWYRGCHNMSAV